MATDLIHAGGVLHLIRLFALFVDFAKAAAVALENQIPVVKVMLVGDTKRKADYLNAIKELAPVSFPNLSVAKLGVEVHRVLFFTNRGPVVFHIWDAVGNNGDGNVCDGFFIQGKCAIIMCDDDGQNAVNWHSRLARVCGNIPIALCGNQENISARSSIEKPFLWLARKVSGDNQLHFVEGL